MAPAALLPLLLENASWLVPALLAGGAAVREGTGSGAGAMPTPAITPEDLQAKYRALMSEHGDNAEAAHKALFEHVGPERVWAQYSERKPKKAPGKMAKLGGAAGKAFHYGTTGLFALGTIPMLLEMMRGAPGPIGGEVPPQGGGEDLMALLSGLSRQAGGSYEDTRAAVNRSFGALSAQEALDARSGRSNLRGTASDLEQLIRGHENELARIAYSEPMTIAQAYAMQGLMPRRTSGPGDFRSML